MSTTVRIPDECRGAIAAHAERAFPDECCGVLLGRDHRDGTREIVCVVELENAEAHDRARRYLIEPHDLLAAERTARELGLEVVGVYHSHPERPASPSEHDRAGAMPSWSYVIVSCVRGKAGQMQSWRLSRDGERFEDERMR